MDKKQALAREAALAKAAVKPDYSAHPELNEDGSPKLKNPPHVGVFQRNSDGSLTELEEQADGSLRPKAKKPPVAVPDKPVPVPNVSASAPTPL